MCVLYVGARACVLEDDPRGYVGKCSRIVDSHIRIQGDARRLYTPCKQQRSSQLHRISLVVVSLFFVWADVGYIASWDTYLEYLKTHPPPGPGYGGI